MAREREETGRAVQDGVLRYVSVSQVSAFDPGQYGGCNRRWFFEKVKGLEGATNAATRTGVEGHEQLEHYMKTGEDVLGPLLRPGMKFIPARGDDILIEHAFGSASVVHLFDTYRKLASEVTDERSAQLVGEWHTKHIKPIERNALLLGADKTVPMIGYIDIAHRRGFYLDSEGVSRADPPRTAELLDWKTTSSIESYAKTGAQLIETVQMPSYAQWSSQQWPDLENFRLSHVYFQTRGKKDSVKRTVLIPLETVKERWQSTSRTVAMMQEVARETDENKVEANYESCGAYRGCPHRHLCPRSREQVLFDTFGGGQGMSLLKALQAATGEVTDTKVNPDAVKAEVERRALPVVKDGATVHVQHEANKMAQDALNAERQKLLDEEQKASERGVCSSCSTALTPENSAQDRVRGGYLHIACPNRPADVLPPDAPTSTPPESAEQVPPEVKATLPEEIRKEADKFDPAAVEVTAEWLKSASRDALKAEAVRRGLVAANSRAREDSLRELLSKAVNIDNAKDHAAKAREEEQSPSYAPDLDKHEAGEPPAPKPDLTDRTASGVVNALREVGVYLIVDAVVDGWTAVSLEGYINAICETLCKQYNAADLRCAPQDSPLGYNKWKGALAACVKAAPPPAGVYVLTHVSESEIKQVVVEALRPLCKLFIRGNR